MTGTEVLAAVRDLLPALRERAQETEDLRRLPGETVKSLQECGFFTLLQPGRYGGAAASPVHFYEAVTLLGSACGSTGWVASVLGVHPWHVALFDDRAQQEVWGEDVHTRISSSYAPAGRATPVPGGFRFGGRWSFSSGCDHATWVLLGGLVLGEDGRPVDFRTFLLPIADYTIVDVWDTVGLRGTGSNDILVEDVFVPEHRTLSFSHTAQCVCPGQEVNPEPVYRLPYGTVHPFAITAPIIGMARGAYEAHVGHTRARLRAAYLGEKAAEDPFAQVRVAEAASDIDAAWLQLRHTVEEELALAEQGARIPVTTRLRARRDQVLGTARAIGALDRLFESAGGKAINNGLPIPRFWRDAHAARAHAANDVERALVMFGRNELGIPVREGMF
ncbi:3-hydroxy-9,10-secoandrosta-1,3,5(10)-triene-9,17-dione monooxygenase [Crossiella equi]|uniref:3-hydroxy-9,10-secoandrosta-1,3,5(10)-triene-9, 17-dione monooxygenase n=1 Tax=Crossiella equi TaxID=130796 RepID=A0ABS5AND6_9PSEU|nr:3-hydroxy-9,10-secoandrosta-1,3,5(10)-triene-9,17-dione monooxygenase oxygenase subunit [Crossiella equi]MBP2478093.1 3-hydroxy-9,10-secoandrosta-1,3,5(10)-triene-9,17-dione monooxygenase [Crossiella equi]